MQYTHFIFIAIYCLYMIIYGRYSRVKYKYLLKLYMRKTCVGVENVNYIQYMNAPLKNQL